MIDAVLQVPLAGNQLWRLLIRVLAPAFRLFGVSLAGPERLNSYITTRFLVALQARHGHSG